MSDSTEDAVIQHLRDRERDLTRVIVDATARREEVQMLIATLHDGRTRVRRKLKDVVTLGVAPGNGAAEQPNVAPPPEAA